VSIFVIPLLLGGVKPAAQLMLAVLAVLTAAAWLLAQAGSTSPRWHWLGAEPLILAGALLLVLEVTPLPEDWLDRLSPSLNRLLPLWSQSAGDRQLGEWHTISLAPAEARSGLVNFGAYALLFLVTAQRIRTAADAGRILGWIAIAVTGQAVFGLAQFLFSNGRFFWVIAEPGLSTADEFHGSFLNRNHAAHFLMLGVGPLLRLVVGDSATRSGSNKQFTSRSAMDRSMLTRPAAWAGLACTVLACALTMSRGGLLAMGASAVVFVLVSQRGRSLSAGILPVAAILAGGVAAAMFLPGAGRIEQRLASLASLDIDQLDQAQGRRRIWAAVAAGIAEFPILGSGPGTVRTVHPLYFNCPDEQLEYTTADCGYLELALESGTCGLLLAVMAVAFLISRSLRAVAMNDPACSGCAAAVLAGVAGSALHSLVQSSWFIPGCMALLIPIAASAVALWRLDVRQGRSGIALPRSLCALAAAALPCCLIAVVPIKQDLMRNAMCRKALDPLTTDAREFDPARLDVVQWQTQLDLVGRNAAGDPRVHLALAGQYLQLFEQLQKSAANPLTLTEIRDTVAAGAFHSPEEVQSWISRAFHDSAPYLFAAREHARRAVESCPLEGRGYVYLSELAFLDLQTVDARRELLDQASRVRPHDAHVMFAAGQLEFQAGDVAGALAHWKRAYHTSRIWEATVTDALIHILPADEFLAGFQPDWTALRELRHRLKGSGHPGYELILRRLADATVIQAESAESERAATLWLEAWQAFDELQDHERARQCACAAVTADPGSYEAHLKSGQALLQLGRSQDAIEEFRWCLRRKPDDQHVAGMLTRLASADIVSEAPRGRNAPSVASGRLISDAAVQRADMETHTSSAGESGRINHRAAVTQVDFVSPLPRKD
jgi:tetratricopeptide (TPR) repeat protein